MLFMNLGVHSCLSFDHFLLESAPKVFNHTNVFKRAFCVFCCNKNRILEWKASGWKKPTLDVPVCAGDEADKELCDEASPPGPVPCLVPCPKDCVLSPWTSWSTCSQTCSSKTAEGKQTRTRAVLAYSAREGNEQTGRGTSQHPSSSPFTRVPSHSYLNTVVKILPRISQLALNSESH